MRLGRIWVLAVVSACAPAALGGSPEKFALSFEGGYHDLSNAPQSAKAVFAGSTGGSFYGGALRLGLGRAFFVGAGLHVFEKNGERVYVDGPGGTVFPLGHPLNIRVRPIFGFVGWRYRPDASLVPYLSAGGGVASYREQSTIAQTVETSSINKTTWHAALGADYAAGSVGLGVEARWTWIPDAIGLGGVSKVYGETDLGGFSVLGRISFRR